MNELYNSIAPKFRSRKAFVKQMETARASILMRGDRERADGKINAFCSSNENNENTFILALVGFSDNSHPNKYLSVSKCIQNNTWDLTEYRNTWMRLFIVYQIDFFNFQRIHLERPKPAGKGCITLPVGFGDLVAMMAIFGNRNLFENAVNFSLDVFDGGFTGGAITYLTQLFILRLSEHFLGYPPRDWLNHKHWGVDPREQEPLFAALWEHWEDTDTSVLEPLLVQLLNRHTYQASRNNKDGDRDFEGHSEQFPMELQFIYRLREWRGLTNPAIKHRLTEPPFDVLPEPMQELIFDEQTIQFMSKVRASFPDFDAVINSARTRDWKMLL